MMRFLRFSIITLCSFLLFSFSTLHAQDCDIEIVAVETFDCNNDTGTYSVEIVYEVDNETNDSIDVWVNNDFAGQFLIGNALVIDNVEPSNGNFGLIVICVNNNTECCNAITFEEPDCSDEEECEVNFEIETSECDPATGTYTLTIFYNIQNPGNELLDLWVNNDYVGNYEIGPNGEGTITVEGVEPRENTDFDIVEICVNDNDNCCHVLEYLQPEGCGDETCTVIEGVELETFDCNPENGSYSMNVYFNLSGDASGQISVYINDFLIGEYDVDSQDSPIVIDGIENTDDGVSLMTFCVTLDNGNICCEEIEYEEPECTETCSVNWIEVETSECADDGTYTVTIFYNIENATSDFLDLWVNDDFIDEFPINGEPITVEGVTPRPNSDFDIIEICVDGNDDCCLEYEYLHPECEALPCEVFFEIETSECDPATGTYTLTIFYNVTNPGNEFLDLWVNNEYEGFYEIGPNGEGVIVVEGVEPRENTDYDIVQLCINDNDDCCYVLEYMQPEGCGEVECIIEGLEVDAECGENGLYYITIFYNLNTEMSGDIDIEINGDYVGTFEFNSPEGSIVIDGLEPTDNGISVLTFCVEIEGLFCCEEIEYEEPECGEGECAVNWIEVETSECNPENGSYNLTVWYEITNATGDNIDLWINGNFIGFYPISGEPITVEGVEALPDSDIATVTICANDNDACCLTIEYEEPQCEEEECIIAGLELEAECGENGLYYVTVFYNLDTDQEGNIDVYINDDLVASESFGLGNLEGSFIIDGLEPTDNGISVLTFCVETETVFCCEEIEYEEPECGEGECEVGFDIETSECDPATGTYTLTISYFIQNPGNDFLDLWVNNEYEGFYEIGPNGEGTITVEGVEPRENTDFDIVEICVNDNGDCCHVIEYLQPEGCGEEACIITGVEVEAECGENGLYFITIFYNLDTEQSGSIDIEINGDYVGTFEFDSPEGSIVIDGLEPTDNGISVLTFCVEIEGLFCCEELEYEEPECGEGECAVNWIEVETSECNPENGSYNLTVWYEITNPTGDNIDLWINGNFIGFYPISGEPITVEGVEALPDSDIATVTICANDNDACCLTIEYEEPQCEEGECSVDFIEVETSECNPDNGSYTLTIFYGITNPGNDLLDLWINGEYIGSFTIGSDPIIVDGVEPVGGGDNDFVQICVNDNDNCCLEFEYFPPDCLLSNEDPPLYNIMSETPSDIVIVPEAGVELNSQIYNMDGKLIHNIQKIDSERKVSLKNSGIYIFRIETDRKVFYHKILSIQ